VRVIRGRWRKRRPNTFSDMKGWKRMVKVGEVEVEVNLPPTVSRPVCFGVRPPSGTRDQFVFLLEIFFRHLLVYYFVAPSLTRGLVCNLLLPEEVNCTKAYITNDVIPR
jgi:hypothetical protein